MQWVASERGWQAEPRDVLDALAGAGFQEYKYEVTRGGRDRSPTGGVWQGLDSSTGTVASAIWVRRLNAPALVFIDIDGRPIEGENR
jgi:hypothetical protein